MAAFFGFFQQFRLFSGKCVILRQEQVSAILERYVSSRIESESVHQHAMVEESLTTAFNELHSGQAKKNARGLFAQ